ncbi:hypothetical protein DFH06DRAFT_1401021 [Mycena polygramma]|nr:hypothetical protein DFH06DRAFT_1401021 [Mycena polygramma]
MAEDPVLSDTSEEETVTPQEKRRKTRAQHLLEEEAENAKRDRETAAAVRPAKKKALDRKIWEEKQAPAEPEPAKVAAGRKRAPSSTGDTGKAAKKAKAKPQADSDDDEVGVSTKRAPAKTTSKTPSKSVSKPKTKDKAKGAQTGAGRRYLARDDVSSDDERVPQPPVTKAPKPITKKTAAAAGKAAAPPRPTPKPKNAASDPEDDALPSQSDDEDPQLSDARSQSEGEDGTSFDPLLERPQVIATRQSAASDDLLTVDDDDDVPDRRRRASSSSAGSAPPDTDYDYDMEQQPAEDTGMDDAPPWAGSEDDLEDMVPVPRRKTHKISAQQLKYNQEQPEIRASKVMHTRKAAPEPTSESDYHITAQIVFPAKVGPLKLLDQNDTLQEITKSAIAMHLYEIAYKAGYEAVISRASLARRLLRICAKKHSNGQYIEKRAKQDTQFCTLLATIICTRGGNLKTALRKAATSTVATHYELNKTGTTPSQVRSIVKQLLKEQRYILPYAATPPRNANTVDNADAADDNAAVTHEITKTFVPDLPFHAPALVDLIHETWWHTTRALGFKYVKELTSNRADRPHEIVLPDAMICLAGCNMWAALMAYQTGRHVPAPEFSQARLEGTYNSLLAVLEKQRAGSSAKYFNTTMHKLYLKVSQSPDVAMEASGSANSAICLPVDSD